MRAFVITIKDRIDSFNVIKDQLKQIGVEAIMLPAFDARKPENLSSVMEQVSPMLSYFLGRNRFAHWQVNSPGAIGCAKSHLNAWKMISEQPGPCLVVEDDFRLSPHNKKEDLEKALASCKALLDTGELDYILMCHGISDSIKKPKKPFVLRVLTPFAGTQIQMVSPVGASKLLSYCKSIECHIDSWIGMLAGGTAGYPIPFKLGVSSRNFHQDANIKSTF